jgi:prepilin-type N-terminal cleavage/methylation domain-containing protein
MSNPRTANTHGFTVIELMVVAVVVTVAGAMIYFQTTNASVTRQDEQRKTAINAMYYALEEVYYPKHNGYPEQISSDVLTSVDPALFTDPSGFTLGKDSPGESLTSPNYHYDATGCDDSGICRGYTLRSDMAKEAQYIKKNRDR